MTSPTRLGRYETLFELARGGMGSVFVARLSGAHRFERLVAIKLLHEALSDPATLQAFLTEARLTAKIPHPNVVQTLELDEDHNRPFIVMDLVDGIPLSRLIAVLKEHRLPSDAMLMSWIAAEAAEGLHAAHQLLGLVHRDVSPQNILLSFDGAVRVADFGIAKVADSTQKTREGLIKGKFSYMSPEQASALDLDRRSDVFSLGIVLYEALTLRRPFQANSPSEILVHVIHGRYRSLREARPELPEELHRLVERSLATDREERFATCREMSDALRAVLRAHGSRDGRDLARLLGELLESEREAMRERVKQARDAAVGRETPQPNNESTVETTAASLDASIPLTPRRYGLLLAIVVALGIATSIAFLTRDDEPAIAPETIDAEQSDPTPASSGVDTKPPETAPPPSPSPSAPAIVPPPKPSLPRAAPSPSQTVSAAPAPSPAPEFERGKVW